MYENVQKPYEKTPLKINLSKHGNGKRAYVMNAVEVHIDILGPSWDVLSRRKQHVVEA